MNRQSFLNRLQFDQQDSVDQQIEFECLGKDDPLVFDLDVILTDNSDLAKFQLPHKHFS